MQIRVILDKTPNDMATNKTCSAGDDYILFAHKDSKLLCSMRCLREKFVLLCFN